MKFKNFWISIKKYKWYFIINNIRNKKTPEEFHILVLFEPTYLQSSDLILTGALAVMLLSAYRFVLFYIPLKHIRTSFFTSDVLDI